MTNTRISQEIKSTTMNVFETFAFKVFSLPEGTYSNHEPCIKQLCRNYYATHSLSFGLNTVFRYNIKEHFQKAVGFSLFENGGLGYHLFTGV